MKKLLGILSALGIAATTSGSVVSCGEEMQHPPMSDDIANNKSLILWGTKFLWNSDKTGILHIYMNHDLTKWQSEGPIKIKILKDGVPLPLDFRTEDVSISGLNIRVNFNRENSNKLKETWSCSVDIVNRKGEYTVTKDNGATSGTMIGFGNSFWIPHYNNS